MTSVSPVVKLIRGVMGAIEQRAKQQDKSRYLMPIYKMAFDQVAECIKTAAPPATRENTAGITVDTLLHMHAGMIALMRLTNSDDLIRWARPNMLSYADDPDFQRVEAV